MKVDGGRDKKGKGGRGGERKIAGRLMQFPIEMRGYYGSVWSLCVLQPLALWEMFRGDPLLAPQKGN